MNLKYIFHFAIGPIVGGFLNLVSLPLMTWFFSTEDIGRISMLNVTISFCLLLFSFGLDQAYVREYHEENDKIALLKATIMPGLIVLLLTIAIISISPFQPSKIVFGISSRFVSLLLAIAIISSFITSFLGLILRMAERGLAYSATQFLPPLLFLLLVMFGVFFKYDSNFDNLMIAKTSSILFGLAVFLLLTRDDVFSTFYKAIDKGKAFEYVKFGFPLVLGGLAFWGSKVMDRFFLRAFSDFHEIGIYSIALTFSGMVQLVSGIFTTLWHPTVYKWIKNGVNPNKIQPIIENMLILIAIIWSFTGLFSWLALYFLPPQYLPVRFLLVAAIAAPLFYMLSETTVIGIGISRRTSFSMIASFVVCIINAVLNYFLIPNYGAAGASVASAISFFFFFLVRTEASAYLWVSFPRWKMYSLLLLYLIVTVFVTLLNPSVILSALLWVSLLLLCLFLFRMRVKITSMHLFVKVCYGLKW